MLMSAPTTVAPDATNAAAMARPSPLSDPVTTARLPCSEKAGRAADTGVTGVTDGCGR